MSKVLLAGIGMLAMTAAMQPAVAADMPVKARPIVAAPLWSWSGFYIGGNVGYSWGRSDTHVPWANVLVGQTPNVPIDPLPPGSTTRQNVDLDGWLGGGQVGFNHQSGNWVYGLEGDFQWTGQRGTGNFVCTGSGPVTVPPPLASSCGSFGATRAVEMHLEWFATARARAGMLVMPSTLAYVTGGLAVGSLKATGTTTFFPAGGTLAAPIALPPTVAVLTTTDTNWGWTIGGGLEHHLVGNLTGKIEYLYLDFGRFVIGTNGLSSAAVTDHVVRFGLNYKLWDFR